MFFIFIFQCIYLYELTAQWHRQHVSPSQTSLPVQALVVPPPLVSLLAAAGSVAHEEEEEEEEGGKDEENR